MNNRDSGAFPSTSSSRSDTSTEERQLPPRIHTPGSDASTPEVEQLRAELRTALATIQQLRRENEEARTARWRAEIQQHTRLPALQALADSQAHAIRELRASTSWRITRPLRESSSWLSKQAAALRRLRLVPGLASTATTAAQSMADGYPAWIQRFDSLSAEDVRWIQQHIAAMQARTVHITWRLGHASFNDVLLAIDSLQSQYLRAWTASLLVDAAVLTHPPLQKRLLADARLNARDAAGEPPASNADAAQQPQLVIEGAGQLAPHALYLLQEAASRTGARAVLSDEDLLDADGTRHTPRFLPRYSPEFPTVSSLAYLDQADDSGPAALDRTALPSLVATAITADQPPAHVPFVLFHARRAPALAGTENDRVCTGERTRWPFVSIVIPTRDRFDLMDPCLSSILERSDYPRERYEIVVVDNGSVEPALLDHLAALEQAGQIRVIKDPRKFNYARLNNQAATATQGELLAFVNNDIVVHDPLWLQRLAAQAIRPEVGVVGAKLLYPDHTVQHGGVVLGIQGVAAHAHHNLAANDPGYLGLGTNTHAVSAVTGACLMLRREVFEQVGGFDEKLAVAFNDTLLCMDVLALGLRNVYVAHPLLIHFESKTRGLDDNEAKRALFRKESRYARSRNRALFKADPYYNPNLSLERTYDLAFPPRQAKPWHRQRRAGGRMRLLLLSSIHQIGHGVPVVLDIHARHLAHEGHEVILGGPRGEREFDYPGCTRVYLDSPQEAAAFAVEHGVDCVVMHTPPFFSTMRWLGPDIKTVVYDHGEPPPGLFPDAEVRRHQLIEKDFCLEMADALYANSQATRDESGHARMGVIPLGNTHLAQWDPSMQLRRDDVRRAMELDGKIVVLNVCRFHKGERYYKGIDDYCAIKDRLDTEFPDEAQRFVFMLVGKGTEEDVEEMESRGLRVFANVSDAQMMDLYCCADIYANFSKWEGYNLGIGQALAMGLDVVASDIPVHRSFPIFTSSNTLAQVQKILEFGHAHKARIARVTPWTPALIQLSDALIQVVYDKPM